MSISHEPMIVSTPDGYLPSCTCGWRNLKFVKQHHDAVQLADEHEMKVKTSRLNLGSKKPSLKTVAKQYRDNAANPVFTSDERVMWDLLATEAEEELAKRENAPLEGQMELF